MLTAPSRIILFGLAVASLSGLGTPARAEVEQHSMILSSGVELHYTVVTPPGFDNSQPANAIIAFPMGAQKFRDVDWGIRHYWGQEAERRGYLVFSPEVTGDKLFFEGGETIIPEFIARLHILYQIRNRTFHAVGIANGGMSALQVASRYPEHFSSVLALAGYFWTPSQQKYAALRHMCIILIAGSLEIKWADGARRDHKEFTDLGMRPFFELLPRGVLSSGHYADNEARKLFDMIENRTGC